MSFASFGLHEGLLKTIIAEGYEKPSPIQEQAIPAVLKGRDLMAAAQTGTGKTAAFTLPILHRLIDGPRVKPNHIRALILTPTRELAAQVANNVSVYGKNTSLRSTVVYGGIKINPQMMKLRKGIDVLVATPGRLLDLFKQNAVKFSQVEVVVLDEADRMLDMGFINDIQKILSKMPKERQNLMFSATFSSTIQGFAKDILNDELRIAISPENKTAKSVDQWICPVDKSKKTELLTHLIRTEKWKQALVFTKTKHCANRLSQQLSKKGILADAIHGNKTQGARTKALAQFKQGKIQILVATDIAARGIDIDLLPHVVNFELPHSPEDYIHRIGRTGRAGSKGEAISLVSADEAKQLFAIERLIKQALTRKLIDGYEPLHDVPETRPNQRPSKPGQRRRRPQEERARTNRVKRAKPGAKTTHRKGAGAAKTTSPANSAKKSKPYDKKKSATRTGTSAA